MKNKIIFNELLKILDLLAEAQSPYTLHIGSKYTLAINKISFLPHNEGVIIHFTQGNEPDENTEEWDKWQYELHVLEVGVCRLITVTAGDTPNLNVSVFDTRWVLPKMSSSTRQIRAHLYRLTKELSLFSKACNVDLRFNKYKLIATPIVVMLFNEILDSDIKFTDVVHRKNLGSKQLTEAKTISICFIPDVELSEEYQEEYKMLRNGPYSHSYRSDDPRSFVYHYDNTDGTYTTIFNFV